MDRFDMMFSWISVFFFATCAFAFRAVHAKNHSADGRPNRRPVVIYSVFAIVVGSVLAYLIVTTLFPDLSPFLRSSH